MIYDILENRNNYQLINNSNHNDDLIAEKCDSNAIKQLFKK